MPFDHLGRRQAGPQRDVVEIGTFDGRTTLNLAINTPEDVTISTLDLPPDMATAARQAATLGKKGHVFGIGPEIAYIKGAGEYLLDGRVIKEFAAEDRPSGWTAVVTLSRPF